MTAKLILSMDGALIEEYILNKDRMTIGRRADNDIVINNLAVSGQHAVIITIGHDSFMEDMDSTNGLTINGVPTKKHFMQNNDAIEIGKYVLKYVTDHVSQTNPADFEKTMIMRAPRMPAKVYAEKLEDTGAYRKGSIIPPFVAEPVVPPPPVVAVIQILNGPNAGKELNLVKNLTTLGKPGVQVAVLTRRPQGFFITHVEGANFPSVNGQLLAAKPWQLQDHDLIELAGIKMEFYFKN